MKKNHPFHLVTKSPWPILLSMNIMTMMLGMIMWLTKKTLMTMITGIMLTTLCSIMWWRDVTRESTFQGMHTKKVIKGIKMGMILFIISEVMFFSSFFWSFFHSSLAPSIEIGMNWPPKSIMSFNPMEIPLLNTIILLSSGTTITWAHHSLINNKLNSSMKSMTITIILGMYFSILQKWEYNQSQFTMSDSVYGSTFFVATGFHGMHVLVGTMFMAVTTLRMKKMHLTNNHHLGLEMSAWYWHFVDVIWLFLYMMIYWWGK
uniref:Cytochrome c oxidase subunit 3 n=1 Tax=Bambusicaliscelis fanjingensis TaxID=2820089 RepID=A0A8A4VN19_9HEMI|nr:cytochrome c oxidase subunit III [Bambusicaliscelis fanjingensis]QTD82418.1 cytochrome c oxidase subunit 3 [Bambusicaliscelis fanjingensis]